MLSIHRLAAAAVATTALCGPAVAGAVSPDVQFGLPQPAKQNLVSPDVRFGEPESTKQNLVSPDARYGVPDGKSTPQVVTIPKTRIVEVPATGFEWTDAVIGGGATLALVLAASGIAITVRPRRQAATR
jgi:hypothetical protein